MNFIFFLLLLLISAVSGFTVFNRINSRYKRAREDTVTDAEATKYLYKFGYIKPSPLDLGSSKSSEDFETWARIKENAVKAVQEFAGLKMTGKLDEETRQKMTEERCGVEDINSLQLAGYMPWENKEITYAILNFSIDLPKIDVKNVIRQAFDMWSAKIPRTFKEVSPSDTTVNIKIGFGKREHGDSWPFDGVDGTLAHATLMNGLLHFDDDEEWKRYKENDIVSVTVFDLLWVALHEIGHVLGLAHTSVEGSVMSAFYLPPKNIFGIYVEPSLLSSDIVDIQGIYGEKALQPNDCPSLQKHKDIAFSDIKSVEAPLSDCCDICKITPKCKAYSWSDWKGGTCWLKSATENIIDAYDVSLGIL